MSRTMMLSVGVSAAFVISGCSGGPHSSGERAITGADLYADQIIGAPGTVFAREPGDSNRLPDSTVHFIKSVPVVQVQLTDSGYIKSFVPARVDRGPDAPPEAIPLEYVTFNASGRVTDWKVSELPSGSLHRLPAVEHLDPSKALPASTVQLIRTSDVRQVTLTDSGRVKSLMRVQPPVSAPGVEPLPLNTPLAYVTFNPQGQVIDWKLAEVPAEPRQ